MICEDILHSIFGCQIHIQLQQIWPTNIPSLGNRLHLGEISAMSIPADDNGHGVTGNTVMFVTIHKALFVHEHR